MNKRTATKRTPVDLTVIASRRRAGWETRHREAAAEQRRADLSRHLRALVAERRLVRGHPLFEM